MKIVHLLQSTNSPSTLGSLLTFICVHTFRSWASELSISSLGPIPRLGPPAARNFVRTIAVAHVLQHAERSPRINPLAAYMLSDLLRFLQDTRMETTKSSEKLKPRPAIIFVSVPRPYLLQTISNKDTHHSETDDTIRTHMSNRRELCGNRWERVLRLICTNTMTQNRLQTLRMSLRKC